MSNAITKTEVAQRAPINTGGQLAALVPQNIEEAFRLAKALSVSGDMVPKHFQEKPEMIMAAVMRGAEIGLLPMQSLSSIAVINGRASLWGDALPALMQKAGHHLDCEVTGEGDLMVATATLMRGDTGKTITRKFSAADAKMAGLWNKAGPWTQYKPRMLSMRARSWACRDGAADALMGLQVAEEAQDMEQIRDVTPKATGGFVAKAAAAKAAGNIHSRLAGGEKSVADVIAEDERAHYAADEAKDEPAKHIHDAEEAQATHWTEQVNWDEAFPGSKAWAEGALSWQDGFPATNCPYESDQVMAAEWLGGWHGARRAAE